MRIRQIKVLTKLPLNIKTSNASNYRFLSLNNLYWNPGGNINLKPEKGFSSDITLSVTPSLANFKFRVDMTYYRMNIKDLIMWIPTGNGYIWKPVNFSKVLSQGAEISADVTFDLKNTKHKVIANYAYTIHNVQVDYLFALKKRRARKQLLGLTTCSIRIMRVPGIVRCHCL